jgi:hypothetical protein
MTVLLEKLENATIIVDENARLAGNSLEPPGAVLVFAESP